MEKVLKILIIVFIIVISVLFIGCKPSNPLANTTWEGHYTYTGSDASIVFGENSFQLYTSGVTTGTYKASGDAIVFDAGFAQGTGSIIGNKLVMNIAFGSYEFTRVK